MELHANTVPSGMLQYRYIIIYIQLYVPTEYKTTAGRSPNIFQTKTLYVYMEDRL